MKRSVLALVAIGCGGEPTCEGGVTFASDFEEYSRWDRFELAAPDPRLGTGPRAVYLESRPPRDARVFPRCTRIVKTTERGEDPRDWFVVAMAKRGGGYNADGARGWEWFDLDADADGVPAIAWRGPVPPEGSGYECALGEDEGTEVENVGDCNTCHAAGAASDYVLTPELQALLRQN